MITKNINEISYVVFDIETTGFNVKDEQIIEIGAVKVNGQGEIISKFQKFISLYKKDSLPDVIVKLTNITEEILNNHGLPLDEVMEDFYEYIKGSVLVAQNAKFDMSFIDKYYLEKNIFLDNVVLDTIDLGKFLFPDKKTYKLASLIEYFNVDYDENAHHRADYDAQITSEIFVSGMKKIYQEQNKIKMLDYLDIFKLEEATINQKRYLYSLLRQRNIVLKNKVYLSKFNASRQISILSEENN